MCWRGLLPDLVLFRLVAPPLQTGVGGGTYSIWGVWFPNRLPLEGTSHIHIFGVVTSDLRYPGYKTPTYMLYIT
jgi:hypothetical protein